jgi:tripartite-type tricarboxylate transporter receptor subunit TctC
MPKWLKHWSPVVAAALVVSAVSVARAQDPVAEFYRGKSINLIVGGAVGGGLDNYARLLARHIGKYIPGNPAIIPQNMPGAVSNKAASYLFAQAAKDGTAIGAIDAAAVLQPLLSRKSVPHDPSKFIFLGSANADVYLCIVRSDAPVKSFQETFTKEVILGATAEGAKAHDLPVLLDNVLGTKLRIVSGYAGTRELTLALEGGEVQGMCGLSWATLASQHPDWVARGIVRIIVQEDMKGHPEMNKMGVPLTVDFAKTDEDRQVMELAYSQSMFGRPHVLPPGVPPARVTALRAAYMAALRDTDLLADAAKNRLEIEPLPGEDFQAVVAKLYALPPKIIERAKQALIYKPPS